MPAVTWRITRHGTQLVQAVPSGIMGLLITGSRFAPRIFYRFDRIGD